MGDAEEEPFRQRPFLIPKTTKVEIDRLVNEEHLLAASVAKRLNVTQASVARIASEARTARLREGVPGSANSSIVSMPPRPFPEGVTPSLRGKKLTAEEKHYLACLVNVQGVPNVDVAARFDIPAATLSLISRRAREGRPLQSRVGQTPLIDAESEQALRKLASLEGAARPSRPAMKEQLLTEIDKTLERRGGKNRVTCPAQGSSVSVLENSGSVFPGSGTDGADKPTTSQRSITRYLKHFGF